MRLVGTCVWFVVSLLFYISFQQDVSMRAWVEEGYYFSHRCQITIEIVSNYFQSKYQLFHVLAKQNANFFTTIEYSNVFYAKGTNQMQAIMTSSETYCKFPMSSTYYCPFISVSGYDPYGLKYYQPVNSTHNKLTIRLARAICPQEGKIMSFRIQMPISSDYSQFYMYVPDIFNTTPKTVDKLSFVYDQQVMVNLSNLQYKQVRYINSIPEKIFLVGCQFRYPLTFRFDNVSYYNSWDEINVYISNLSLVQLSTICSSNFSMGYSCTKTSYGYRLVNNNQSNMIKSYEIADQEYYEYNPYVLNMQFGLQFLQMSKIDVEVVVKANNNSYQQSWLNMSHNSSQIYGRKIFTFQGYKQQQFLLKTSGRYDPTKCIVPIYINNTISENSSNVSNTTTTTNVTNSTNNSNNNNISTTNNTNTLNDTTNNSTNITTNNTNVQNNTNNSINNTNNTNNYTPPQNDFQFDTSTQSFQINQLIFIIAIIITLSVTMFFTKTVKSCQKMLFLITIFLLSVTKIIYLLLQIDQSWLTVSDPQLNDSIINSNTFTYSLQLFILKYTFLFQFFLNILYFFNYLILILCSQQIHQRIKKFYGTKKYIKNTLDHIQNKSKINQCNLSSVIFTLISVLSFLTNFKIYALIILKLQLDIHPSNSQFKKYRFKNSVLYKIHSGHLGIDLFLESNSIIWLFMAIKSCQNQIFTYVLYIILVFYCIHVYLVAIMMKVFILMGKRTDELNLQQRNRIKQQSQHFQTQHEIDEKDNEIQQIQNQNNIMTDNYLLKVESKESQVKTDRSPIQDLISLSSSKSNDSKLKTNLQSKR